MEYAVDPDRLSLPLETGIFIRAKGADGAWGSFDIAHLSRGSLYAWLRSRENVDWPIDVVMVLLNHRPFGTRSSEIESTDSLNSTLEDSRAYKLSRDEIAQALSEFMIKKTKLSEAWEAFRIEIATDDRKILASLWLCDLNPESSGVGLGLDSAILYLKKVKT